MANRLLPVMGNSRPLVTASSRLQPINLKQ